MTKLLSAEQKANELGITTSGLAKTRHLYKHIKKSPRKYLYLEEDLKEADRPNRVGTPDTPVNSRSRRRNVPFGQENYHKARGGSGNKLKTLNQMRSKMALEGKLTKEEQNTLDEALAYKVKENFKEINEQRKMKLQMELQRDDELTRNRMLKSRNPIQAEPIRKYPHTMISGQYPTPTTPSWKYRDRAEDESNKNRAWYDDISEKYEYY